MLSSDSIRKVFEEEKYAKGCIIVPNFVPDTEIPIQINKEAIECLIVHLGENIDKIQSESFESTI